MKNAYNAVYSFLFLLLFAVWSIKKCFIYTFVCVTGIGIIIFPIYSEVNLNKLLNPLEVPSCAENVILISDIDL